jgi:hypothetical protein
MSAPVVREAWGAVGSPVSTVRNLRAQRPISAPAGECKPKVRKKKLVLGSPKWWARLEAKAEAEIQRKQAIAEEQACADRLNKEVSEDCRNLIAVWWLKVRGVGKVGRFAPSSPGFVSLSARTTVVAFLEAISV